MPKFPKNTGFKLPGLSSRELDTPGGFRQDQGVEYVGYCDNTEFNMLPKGSSPLLEVKPEYYKTTYTNTNWPKGGMPKIQLNNKKEDVEEKKEKESECGEGQVAKTFRGQTICVDEDKNTNGDNGDNKKINTQDLSNKYLEKFQPKIDGDNTPKPEGEQSKKSKVTYEDLYNESIASGMSEADAEKVVNNAKRENLKKFGTHQVTELFESSKGEKGFDTSFDYMGDNRTEAMRKKRRKMGY